MNLNVKSNSLTGFHYEIKYRFLWGIKLVLTRNKLRSKNIIKLFIQKSWEFYDKNNDSQYVPQSMNTKQLGSLSYLIRSLKGQGRGEQNLQVQLKRISWMATALWKPAVINCSNKQILRIACPLSCLLQARPKNALKLVSLNGMSSQFFRRISLSGNAEGW